MTSLVDLHVLRRIAVLGEARRGVALDVLADDCATASAPIGRARCMEAEGLVVIRRRRGVEYLSVTELGLAALDVEPTHYRESYGFTNR